MSVASPPQPGGGAPLSRDAQQCVSLALVLLWASAFVASSSATAAQALDLTAGETGVEVEVFLSNPSPVAVIAQASLEVVSQPEWVRNCETIPTDLITGIRSPASGDFIEPGETHLEVVRFDVAGDAPLEATGELVLQVVAEPGVYPDLEEIRISLRISDVPPLPAAQESPDGFATDSGVAAGGPVPTYLLSEVLIRREKDRVAAGALGYVVRSDDSFTRITQAVYCEACPSRIVLGEPFELRLAVRRRYDWKRVSCPGGVRDKPPPQLRLSFPQGDVSTRGRPLIVAEEDCTKPSTREDQLQLSATFSPNGVTRDDRTSPARSFAYRLDARSDGDLDLGRNTMHLRLYDDLQRAREHNDEIRFLLSNNTGGGLTLVYRLVDSGATQLDVKPFPLPPEFSAPPLSGPPRTTSTEPGTRPDPLPRPSDTAQPDSPRTLAEKPNTAQRPPSTDPARAPTTPPITLPTEVAGRPVDEVLDRLPPVLRPRIEPGWPAPDPRRAGTVESVLPTSGEPLRPGDTVIVRVHPLPIPLPTELVGLPVAAALARIPAGLVPRVVVGDPPRSPELADTVQRVRAAGNGPLYPGDEVVLVAHPEASSSASPLRPSSGIPSTGSVSSPTAGDRLPSAPVAREGTGYVLERILSSQVPPFRLKPKAPSEVHADARGGRILGEVLNARGDCSERVEFLWWIDGPIDFVAIGDEFVLTLETLVRPSCNDRDPFATPGVLLSTRAEGYPTLPHKARTAGSMARLEIVDRPAEGPNRVYGKGESGRESRRIRVQEGPEYLYLAIDFLANSGRESLKWQVVYLFQRVTRPPEPTTPETPAATDPPTTSSADEAWTTGQRATASSRAPGGWSAGSRVANASSSSIAASNDPCNGPRPLYQAALRDLMRAFDPYDPQRLSDALRSLAPECPGDAERLQELGDLAKAAAREEARSNTTGLIDASRRASARAAQRRRALTDLLGAASSALGEIQRSRAPSPSLPPAGNPAPTSRSGSTRSSSSASSSPATGPPRQECVVDSAVGDLSRRDASARYYVQRERRSWGGGSVEAFKIWRLRAQDVSEVLRGSQVGQAHSTLASARSEVDRLCDPSRRGR